MASEVTLIVRDGEFHFRTRGVILPLAPGKTSLVFSHLFPHSKRLQCKKYFRKQLLHKMLFDKMEAKGASLSMLRVPGI